jgi:hypothetical protein
MNISQYQVGQKPFRPLAITVNDSAGRPVDLSFYDDYTVRLIGSDNEEVDLGNGELQTAGARQGRFTFVWPTNKSLFSKAGDYLLQLELSGDGHRDFTTAHNIRVREIGGK